MVLRPLDPAAEEELSRLLGQAVEKGSSTLFLLLKTFQGVGTKLVSDSQICRYSKDVYHDGYGGGLQKHPERRLVQGRARGSLEPDAAELMPQSRRGNTLPSKGY